MFLLIASGVHAQDAAPTWTRLPVTDPRVAELSGRLQGDGSAAALAELKKLADAGDGEALFVLARAYQLGLGVPAAADTATQLLERGGELDHATSLLALALVAESQASSDALFYYRRAAELGSPWAMLRLGHCNEAGEYGLSKNPALGLGLYRQAHEAGLRDATFELARCYQHGIGTSPDAITSARLYRLAADAGVLRAQFAMAQCYSDGYGIPRDRVAAIGWLLLASQRGSVDAQTLLAIRYETGDGVVQDLNQAGVLFSAAARQHNPVALYHLAMMYAEGRGTPKDPVRGYEFLHLARGFPPADKAIAQLESTMTQAQLNEARRRIAADTQSE